MSRVILTFRKFSTEVTSNRFVNNPNIVRRAIDSVVNFYEECIGLSEVHKARSDVTKCEENLYEAQLRRREKQSELKKLQNRLKEIHSELDRTTRGEDRYLYLLTEEHAAIKNEQLLLTIFEELENKERESFNMLSSKVRISHEREREREERTKYWSLTASLIGAFFGILGTSIGNELRMRRFREMIPTSQEVRPVLEEISKLIHTEQDQVAKFIAEIKDAFCLNSSKLQPVNVQQPSGSFNDITNQIKEQNLKLLNQLDELKRLIKIDRTLNVNPDSVVYVGNEMKALLRQTEENLESKMKLRTLLSVVFVYSIIGLSAPVLYFLFNNK